MRGGGHGVQVKIWGARGSIPSPGRETTRYGGDTTCFEVRCGTDRLVIDCGSGMRRLGQHVLDAGDDHLDVLLTHGHADHLVGLGMFAPLLMERATMTIWSDQPEATTKATLDRFYSPPIWPVTLSQAKPITFRRLSGETAIGRFLAAPLRLRHPGGATGYLVAVEQRRIAVITDHELGCVDTDAALRSAATGADLVILDAPYSDAEYDVRRGWGHSSRSAALRFAAAVRAKRVLFSHHDPEADDHTLESAEAYIRACAGAVDVRLARDAMTVQL